MDRDAIISQPPAQIITHSAQLDNLAYEALTAHEAGDKAQNSAMDCYRQAGEALLKAKALVPHGEWSGWLARHVPFVQATARRYMRIAHEWQQVKGMKSLREVIEFFVSPLPEAADLSKDPIATLCERCRRVGPVKDCPNCATVRAAAEQKAAAEAKKNKEKRKKNKKKQEPASEERPAWNGKTFRDLYARLLRFVQEVAKAEKRHESPQYLGLCRLLSEFSTGAQDFFKDSMQTGKCRSCGAPIFWAKPVGGGSFMPIDADPVAEGGNIAIVDGAAQVFRGTLLEPPLPEGAPRYVSHFATCPDAKEWRRKRIIKP